MKFENFEVPIADLPDFKSAHLQPVEKRYKKLIWLNEASVFIVLYGIGISSLFFEKIPHWLPFVILGIVSLVLILRGIEIEKGFRLKKFGIRQFDMIYQSGFFYFTEIVVPYKRIQHVEIKQGPLSRLFSLYSLKLYTAGASSGDLVIDGLEQSTAQKLKAKVLEKTTLGDGAY